MSLRELRVADLAVVAGARLEPGPGFTAVTGETGAGKSVCLAALRLALGGRADPDLVRPGATTARVAAVFDGVPEALRERLGELGLPPDELLTLTRDVPRSGRATSRINGALVSQATLAEIGDALAEVTVQGASQRLVQRTCQRQLLDAFAGPAAVEAQASLARRLASWREAQAALDRARRAAVTSAEEVGRAREVVEDLAPLRLVPGEHGALGAEVTRLRHAAALSTAVESLREASGGGEDTTGAADLLAAAVERARPLAALDPGLEGLVEDGSGIVLALRELASAARRAAESISHDGARLAEVEERLHLLDRVARRHGSVEAALEALARAEEAVAAGEGRGASLGRLEERLERAGAEAAAAAVALGEVRRHAASTLAEAVTRRLRTLELPRARFEILLASVPDPDGLDLGAGPVRCAPHGADGIDFRLATSRDAPPRSLDSGPSGGELSRLALALAALAGERSAPVLVLDEVDAGISGETAARVGDVLAAIGRQRQVIAVTHRSEIAARAGQHLLARRRETGRGTRTEVVALRGGERTREIARLMSGRTTAAALERAEELLLEGSAASPAATG